MLAIGKLVVAIVWIAAARAFLLPEAHPWAATGRTLFLVLAVVHAVEAVLFLPRLRAAGGSLPGHLLQTLLFGFLHVGGLPRAETRPP